LETRVCEYDFCSYHHRNNIAGYFVFRLLLNFYRKPVLEITLSRLIIRNGRQTEDHRPGRFISAQWFLRQPQLQMLGNPFSDCIGFVRPSEQITGVITIIRSAGIWLISMFSTRTERAHRFNAQRKWTTCRSRRKIYCKGKFHRRTPEQTDG